MSADGTSETAYLSAAADAHLEGQRERLFNAQAVLHLACAKLDSEEELDDDERTHLARALMLVERDLEAIAGAIEPATVARIGGES